MYFIMKKTILFLISLTIVVNIFAQMPHGGERNFPSDGTLKGIVIDADINKPVEYANVAGVVSWKAAKVAIAQNASNPTDARYAIIYNDTDANKRCVAWIDLGAVLNLTLGPFEFRFNSVDGTGTILTNTIN